MIADERNERDAGSKVGNEEGLKKSGEVPTPDVFS
jgi:hypothetical protein